MLESGQPGHFHSNGALGRYWPVVWLTLNGVQNASIEPTDYLTKFGPDLSCVHIHSKYVLLGLMHEHCKYATDERCRVRLKSFEVNVTIQQLYTYMRLYS